uniref:Bromo domain-containing protein n=1 Tax=Globodera pallida TaxID=36090 RepID=A0A183BKM4_GLOPA
MLFESLPMNNKQWTSKRLRILLMEWCNQELYPPLGSQRDYHKVIKRPMDLGTIERRLKNMYYYSASECIKDFEQIFANCYKFNQCEDDVTLMCKNVENLYRDRLKKFPDKEVEIPFPSQKKAGKGSAKRNIRASSTTTKGYFHNATVQVSRESSAQRGLPDSSSSIGSVKPEIDSTEEQKGKGVKRKADTTTSFDEEGPSTKQPIKREVRPIKKGPAPVDYAQFKPLLKGKLNERMKFCQKLLNELITSKKCKAFNWPFLEPVDAEALNLPDYFDVIKEPMDLSTIKKKMDARQYTSPEEFLSPSALLKQFKPVDDDEQIDFLLLQVQADQSRTNERQTQLQQFNHELMQLKLRRREARTHQQPPPPLTVQQQFTPLDAQVISNLLPHQPAVKSGRGRKPGSKNKPKTESQKEELSTKEYEFNSEDEHSSEPMTYDEKRQLSQNINNLPGDKLTRELEAYVKACSQPTDKKQKKASFLSNGDGQLSVSSTTAFAGRPTQMLIAPNEDENSSSESSSGSSSSESDSSDSSDSESEEKPNQLKPPAPSVVQSADLHKAAIARSVLPPPLVQQQVASQMMQSKATPQIGVGGGHAPGSVKDSVAVTAASKAPTLMPPPSVSSSAITPSVIKASSSHVHSGAAPLLQTNNPTEISAGIAGSVLDHLLPSVTNDDRGAGIASGLLNKNSWSSLAQKAAEGVSQMSTGTNTTNAYELFRKQAREKEERKRQLKEEEERKKQQRERERQHSQHSASGESISAPVDGQQKVKMSQEEVNRLRELEKERRKREEMEHVDMTSQMEVMANFELGF